MDVSLLHALNGFFARHDGVEDFALLYGAASEALFAGALVVMFVIAREQDVRRTVVAAGLSAGLALALAQVVSRVVDRPRPFVADPETVHLFASHVADPGFPSDHATAAFAIAVAIMLRHRRAGLIVLLFAAVLAVERVGAGVHYPTDVLAGAALGAIVAHALAYAERGPLRRLFATGTYRRVHQ